MARCDVLDIGCGTGETTRQAARAAPAGSALGVDVSGPAVERARELARAEGLSDVAFADVRDPVHYGPDVATALDRVRGFACTREALSTPGPRAATRAVGRLRQELAAHLDDDCVRFDSRAWIVTARRR